MLVADGAAVPAVAAAGIERQGESDPLYSLAYDHAHRWISQNLAEITSDAAAVAVVVGGGMWTETPMAVGDDQTFVPSRDLEIEL